MTPQEALGILRQACDRVMGSKADHALIDQAFQTLVQNFQVVEDQTPAEQEPDL